MSQPSLTEKGNLWPDPARLGYFAAEERQSRKGITTQSYRREQTRTRDLKFLEHNAVVFEENYFAWLLSVECVERLLNQRKLKKDILRVLFCTQRRPAPSPESCSDLVLFWSLSICSMLIW